nr:hypothetical protein [Massilia violaceinigra]
MEPLAIGADALRGEAAMQREFFFDAARLMRGQRHRIRATGLQAGYSAAWLPGRLTDFDECTAVTK